MGAIRWRFVTVLVLALAFFHLVFFDVGGTRTNVVDKVQKLNPNKGGSSGGSNTGLGGSVGPGDAVDVAQMAKVVEPIAPADTEERYAICVAARDQPLEFPEWFVHHYHHHGIRRFYVMDDGSEPPLESFQYPGIPRESITFFRYSAEDRVRGMQLKIYQDCQAMYGPKHKWIAYIDVDEYLEVRQPETLDGILRGFEKNSSIGAVAVNWRMHINGGVVHRPESVRHTYDQCMYDDVPNNGAGSDNKHVKSIVRTDIYKNIINPHVFATVDSVTVGEDGLEYTADHVPSPFRQPITRKRMALHHYALKSRDEFQAKIDRWQNAETPKMWPWFDMVEAMPHEKCTEMMHYKP